MRKPILIIVALALATVGCKLDTTGLPGGSASSGAALLLGKWFIKSQSTVGTTLGVATSYNETDFGTQDFFIFNKDLSLNISEVTQGNGVGVGSYTYDASSQQLVLTDPTGAAETATVTKLTTDSLVYTFNVSVPALGTQYLLTTHLAHK